MRYLLPLLLFFACTPAPDPVEAAFTEYILPRLNDPDSYEFIGVEKVNQYHITREDFLAGLYAATDNAAAKDSMWAITDGPDGYADVWLQYRAKNKLGGTVTQRMYVQIENGKVLSAKEWNEAVPEE